jgi:hypothetical protein
MASNTYTAIATVTVGSGGAANIEFTSIPATYTDLLVKLSGRSTSGGETAVNLRFNGNSSSIYDRKSLAGDGSSASSASSTSQPEVFVGRISANTYTASTFGNMEIYIPNYTGSSNKSLSSDSVAENNATTGYNILIAGLWNNTAAITSIAFTVAGSNFAQYSTATLYGIKNS